MELDIESGVYEWIAEYPHAQRYFEELGIDTSCGGVSLEYACRRCDLDPTVVVARLKSRLVAE